MSLLRLPRKAEPLLQPARYKAMHGGRGGAKSHSIAAVLVEMGSIRKLRILCCREIQRSVATSVKQLLEDKIRELGLSGFYNVTERGITGINGTQFLFAGLRTNPEAIKSMEGIDIVWVEEANTVSLASLELLIPTIRKPGSEIWFSWNRKHASDPVDNMFLGGNCPPNAWVCEIGWRDNPWFPEVLRVEKDWMEKRDRDKYLHIWEGQLLKRSEAKVFNNYSIDDIDHMIPTEVVPRLGADFGFSVDPAVLVKCYAWDRTLYYRNEAWQVGCKIADLPTLFNTVPDAGKYPIRADSSRPDTIAHLRDNGFPKILSATKGAGSVVEGVEFIKSFDVVIHPDCKHIIDEFDTYSYKVDKKTEEILSELEDKKNHTIDSARYALEGYRKASQTPDAVVGPMVLNADGTFS